MSQSAPAPEGPEKHAATIIIRKKRGHRDHGHHGGAWKVAYADFVTAMMAFFLVMWLVSQSEEVKQNIAGYFQDPVAFGQAGGVTLLEGGVTRTGGEAKSPTTVIVFDQQAEMKAKLEQEAKKVMEALDQITALKDIMDQIEVEATADGLRIQLMENDDSHFFEVGGAKLSAQGTEVVAAIGRVVGPMGRGVAVEGYTDSVQYSKDATYTNWELSADRANSARLLLQSSGIDKSQMKEIRGFADTRPKYPDDPMNPRNRRIAILVLNEPSPQPGDVLPQEGDMRTADLSGAAPE
jgi:chemotaxis protein MotB